VSFGKLDVLSRLEQLESSADPCALLKQLSASYDILDLADSDEETFRRGFSLLTKAVSGAGPDLVVELKRTFHIVTNAIDGRLRHQKAALEVLQEAGPRSSMDISGGPPPSCQFRAGTTKH
jgi:hypothetical protein